MAADHSALNEMVRVSGQRGVPVIVIDGQVVVGFDRPRLEWLLAKKPQGPEVGMSVASASVYAREHSLQLPEGAYVGRVKPGSPAAAAGLQAGDVITAVGGQPVRGEDDLQALLAAARGSRVGVSYWRNGEARSAELAL